MNPPGDSAGGKTPTSSQNQTQLQWPGQPHVTANNESHIINEPSLPLHDAGGTRAPPSWSQQSQLRIQEPSQRPPMIANQESHIINEPFQPPHHAAGGRITPPPSSSLQRQHGIQEPGQPPSRVNNESLIPIRQPWRPLYSAGQRTSLEALQDQLLQYHQRPPHERHSLRVNQESHTIMKHKRPPQHAAGRQCPQHIVKNPKEFKELVQRLTGQRSTTSSSSATPPTTTSQSPVVPKTTPFVGHDDIGNNSIPVTVSPTASEILADIESALPTLKEDKLNGSSSGISSSSSTSPYGLSQVPNTLLSNPSNDPRSCAKCGNTCTTQWRNGPRGPESLCNACGIRFNRKEETRAATASASSNILLPPGMSLPPPPSFEQDAPYGFSHLQNRVQLMDNVSENSLLGFPSELQSSSIVSPLPEMSAPAAPGLANIVQLAENILLGDPLGLQSSSPLRDPPEVASMMEEFRQSLTDKTPDNSPEP